MNLIQAFSFIGVYVPKEFFNTTSLDMDISHLRMRASAFIRYWGVGDSGKLFMKFLVQNI